MLGAAASLRPLPNVSRFSGASKAQRSGGMASEGERGEATNCGTMEWSTVGTMARDVDGRTGICDRSDCSCGYRGGREDSQPESCRRRSNPAGQSLPHFY